MLRDNTKFWTGPWIVVEHGWGLGPIARFCWSLKVDHNSQSIWWTGSRYALWWGPLLDPPYFSGQGEPMTLSSICRHANQRESCLWAIATWSSCTTSGGLRYSVHHSRLFLTTPGNIVATISVPQGRIIFGCPAKKEISCRSGMTANTYFLLYCMCR